MKFGIRGHDFGTYTPKALIEKYKEKGVETVQLAVPKAIEGVASYHDVTDAQLADIKAAFDAGGVGIAVLGCYIEPSLQDDSQRKAQVETFKKGIYCASALGASCIGTETTTCTADMDREKAFSRLCASLEEMLKEAQKYNVTVAVEPVFWHTLNSPELVLRLADTFKGSGLKFIFDPVNLLPLQVLPAQNEMWQRCFEAFGMDIMAMHIKDLTFNGEKQVPCLLGEGVMDFTQIAAWLKKHRPDMPLLREEIAWSTADKDLDFMRKTFA